MCGRWVVRWTVSPSVSLQVASAPLVSIGQTPQRWVRKRCLSTTSAWANSASTSASFFAISSGSKPPVKLVPKISLSFQSS